MKILVVHNDYQAPGGERTAVEAQLALLRQHGHEVVVYARDNREIQRYDVLDKALFFPRAVFSPRTYRELTALARQERPDVAHVHNVFPLISPATYLALHAAAVPTVQTVHNFRLLCPNALFYTHGAPCERCKAGQTLHAVRWRCYRDSYALSALYAFIIGIHRRAGSFARIDRFIAVSDFCAQKLIEGGVAPAERISVLGNFLPDPLPEPGAVRARSPSVVFIGRLSAEKGVATLVEAAALAPEVAVKVLGDGPDAARCRALAETSGATNVQFLGHVTGAEKWSLLRDALAVVVPSVCYEALPFALLEGMAAGTPVVATRHGAAGSIIEEGKNGWLFSAGDRHELAARLRALVRDPEAALAMGQCARQTMETRWSAHAHYQGLLRIYEATRTARGG